MLRRRNLLPIWAPKPDDDPETWTPNTLLDGLVASYQFENAADLGHDDFNYANLSQVGTAGTLTQVSGKDGYGLSSSGDSTGFVGVYLRGENASTDVDISAGCTLLCWAKTDNNATANDVRTLLSLCENDNSHTAANPDPTIILTSVSGSHIPTAVFYDSGDTYRTLTLSAVSDPTQWHLYVLRFASGAQSFSIDDGTPATASYTIDTVMTPPSQNLRRVLLGQAHHGNATMDGVLIYDRVLTDAEIALHYQSGLGRFYGFGFEGTLERASSAADSTSPITAAVLSRATSVADSTTALTPGIMSRATSAADSNTAVTNAVLSRATSAADSETAITPGTLSRATSAADSTDGITPATLSRATSAADSTTAYTVDVATLSRATSAADSTDGITPGTLSRATSAADSTSGITPATLSRATSVADSTTAFSAEAATLSRATSAATSNRTARAASDPSFLFVFPTAIESQNGRQLTFLEETHNRITATLKNEFGDTLSLTDFDLVLLTLHSKSPFGFLRKTMSAADLVTLADGDFAWLLEPRDTDFQNDVQQSGSEQHVATFEFGHAATAVEDLVDPFATTEDSKVITVTHPAHGLSVGEHVWFDVEEEVGGLSLTGLFIVTEVVSVNSYRTVAHQDATSTATGGGAVIAYLRAISNKWQIPHAVTKADLI